MTEPLTSMKILVCGSRTWEDREMILDALREFEGQDVTVIHGGARGADQMAGEIAESFDFKVQVFLPDWSRGRQAGFDRNIEMLDEEPDLVLAFRKNKSNGTTHTINEAHKRGIKCVIFDA